MYLRITDVQMFRYYRVVFLFPVLDVSEFSAKTSDFVFTSVSRDPVLCPFCHQKFLKVFRWINQISWVLRYFEPRESIANMRS